MISMRKNNYKMLNADNMNRNFDGIEGKAAALM